MKINFNHDAKSLTSSLCVDDGDTLFDDIKEALFESFEKDEITTKTEAIEYIVNKLWGHEDESNLTHNDVFGRGFIIASILESVQHLKAERRDQRREERQEQLKEAVKQGQIDVEDLINEEHLKEFVQRDGDDF